MKKIFILLVIAISMIACIFESKPDTNVYHKTERTNDVYRVPVIHMSEENNTVNLRVVVIDSCEYLIGNTSSGYAGYGYLTHKGNCKYCAERRKKIEAAMRKSLNQNNYSNYGKSETDDAMSDLW